MVDDIEQEVVRRHLYLWLGVQRANCRHRFNKLLLDRGQGVSAVTDLVGGLKQLLDVELQVLSILDMEPFVNILSRLFSLDSCFCLLVNYFLPLELRRRIRLLGFHNEWGFLRAALRALDLLKQIKLLRNLVCMRNGQAWKWFDGFRLNGLFNFRIKQAHFPFWLSEQGFLLALWRFLDWYFRNLSHGDGQVGLLLLDYRPRLVGFVESNVPIKILKPAIDPRIMAIIINSALLNYSRN